MKHSPFNTLTMKNLVWASKPFTVKFSYSWDLSFPIGTRLTWSDHAGCYIVSPIEAIRQNPHLANVRELFLHDCKNRYIFVPKDLPKRVLVQYDIPEWAVCAMVNDDFDGLGKDEADMVHSFQAVNMVWECCADLESESFFSQYPAFGLPTTCISLNCICEEIL